MPKRKDVWIVSVKMTNGPVLAGQVMAVYTSQQEAINHVSNYNDIYQLRTNKDDKPYYYESKELKGKY